MIPYESLLIQKSCPRKVERDMEIEAPEESGLVPFIFDMNFTNYKEQLSKKGRVLIVLNSKRFMWIKWSCSNLPGQLVGFQSLSCSVFFASLFVLVPTPTPVVFLISPNSHFTHQITKCTSFF
jgi:hypothetical protein